MRVFAEHKGRRRNRTCGSELDELGLVRLTGAEQSGGSGAGWHEAAELLSAAVRHGVRIPLAEHDLLACWLLDASGLPSDGAARTACLLDEQMTATGVPWAAGADRIVLVWRSDGDYLVADVHSESLDITPGANMIGEPRDTVTAGGDTLSGAPVSAERIEELRRKSALVRSIQLCAALDRILELSVEHSTSRIQFGRPLSKFQTVQNLISDIAAEAALARAATEAALTAAVTSDWSGANLDFLVAVARSCAGHAASVVVRNAHQVHGAIGVRVPVGHPRRQLEPGRGRQHQRRVPRHSRVPTPNDRRGHSDVGVEPIVDRWCRRRSPSVAVHHEQARRTGAN